MAKNLSGKKSSAVSNVTCLIAEKTIGNILTKWLLEPKKKAKRLGIGGNRGGWRDFPPLPERS